ncbi:hypothetical protein CERZMDRAFT_111066 [Cercospora zeae-maydis SCOH1-5]|uniref:Integral membrane protein n=1 Tax=Cercospora zeae-maydis SCOH1-5 TaxID=717836 RepID=A0A6A6FL30_9PEZI|nr:hypothetical protein CERZMDRAFT_111066 [Cercospora zeae-maydis SCOH1-5]
MSNKFLKQEVYQRPLSYEPPAFPSLYWPFPVSGPQNVYLYDVDSMWRFTLYWTLICIGGVHMIAAAYACAMQWRNWKLIWVVPLVYAVIGATEAVIAGCVTGILLAGCYSGGFFRMSTWIPFAWGITNSLVLILASFAIQGGM